MKVIYKLDGHATLAMTIIYRVYYYLSYLIFFIYSIWKLPKRMKSGKETESSALQKQGLYTISANPLIWIHAASVGELVSASELIRQLKCHVLVTTVTQSSGKMFEKLKLGDNVIHQYAPLDSPLYVRRFLDKFQPKLGIFIDSELWPNMLIMAKKQCKLINLNARISEKSYKRWRYFRPLIKMLYCSFDYIFASSLDDQNKITHLTNRKVDYIGNLKLTVPPLTYDEAELNAVKAQINGRFVITLATFHEKEMDVVIDLLNSMQDSDFLFILAPKHITKLGDIPSLQNIAYRSKGEPITSDTRLYVADTIGEMGLWYASANISVVGGSFSSVEGHNIIEPAKLGSAVVIGERYNNFKDLVNLFKSQHAIEIVKDHNELKALILALYEDPARLDALKKAAQSCLGSQEILGKLLRIIEISAKW